MLISSDEWKEIALRLISGHKELQEVTSRYMQVCAADEAAKIKLSKPNPSDEWKAAAEEYAQAIPLYRHASDILASLSFLGLWPKFGPSVGSHILSLCDKWVDNPAERKSISMQMERIHFAMMQMAEAAADPYRAKPSTLPPSVLSALEASGWKESSKEAVQDESIIQQAIQASQSPARKAAQPEGAKPKNLLKKSAKKEEKAPLKPKYRSRVGLMVKSASAISPPSSSSIPIIRPIIQETGSSEKDQEQNQPQSSKSQRIKKHGVR